MKKTPPHSSKYLLASAAASFASIAGPMPLQAMPSVRLTNLSCEKIAGTETHTAAYDHVLGTSLDLVIEAARPIDARECETRVLHEIERLRRILSTYDPASEIRQVMAGGALRSAELADLLVAYDLWAQRTSGLIDAELGGAISLWREATRQGRVPTDDELAQVSRGPSALNVDALGKTFIIERAVTVARQVAPGGVINLGGDLRAWGERTWQVHIADPSNSAENASPIGTFSLRDAAVATSGGYARYFEIGGQRFSHLIDPRTRRPIAVAGSATVVADDSVTANALSTAAAIGGENTGAALAQTFGARGYFFAAATGRIFSGGILAAAAAPVAPAQPEPAPAASTVPAQVAAPASPGSDATAAPASPAAPAAWTEGFQVDVEVALKMHTGNPYRIHRPYVAVWIQDAKGYIIRTLAAWGEDSRYQRRLSSWWNKPRESKEEPKLVARATRAPGTYTLVWDGKDDFGRRVSAGNYAICLEICREDGNHIVEAVMINCGTEPVKAGLRETAESNASNVTYGPKRP